VCYVLYVASPLTLSEVRSMLPDGMSAHALAPDDDRRLRRALRPARTVLHLLIGPCSCDLLLQRDPVAHSEERALRARYQAERAGRDEIIRAIDLHRAIPDPLELEPPAYWRRALAAFVAEHARTAGPTVYWLRFSLRGPLESPPDPPPSAATIQVADVLRDPDGWLAEGDPIRVVR
jgi:hypothetical protein